MLKNNTFLGIIPAREGSKRLPGKNISLLKGKPLIGWTIEAALKSKYLDEVMVSTDSEKIMDISKRFGANVPVKRPAELATDIIDKTDVILHVLDYYKEGLLKEYDYFIYLQPTSPLRSSKHIDSAIELLLEKEADAVISVSQSESPAQWMWRLPENKNMQEFLLNIDTKSRSQDLELFYRLNGAIFICKVQKFLEEKTVFLKNKVFAYEMSREDSMDIDTQLDFDLAEFYLSKYGSFLNKGLNEEKLNVK